MNAQSHAFSEFSQFTQNAHAPQIIKVHSRSDILEDSTIKTEQSLEFERDELE